jgi:hypothetical protein
MKKSSFETTKYAYILTDGRVPVIALSPGRYFPLVQLIVEMDIYALIPEEVLLYRPYLSLAQIHSALAYYYDHRQELEVLIDLRKALLHTYQHA